MKRPGTTTGLLLTRASLLPERVPNFDEFPYDIPFVRDLDVEFRKPVTCFVGENGSGKSTLIEAIAEACGLPIWGGSRNEAASRHGPDERAALGSALRFAFARRPRDGYFFRAEFQSNFASLLDAREADPEFMGDPYTRYGGRSLHAQSHGEAFLAVMLNRIRSGMFIMDEPESALSPQRQLALLARMAELVRARQSQFVIATHSPILLTFPDADIISVDETPLRRVALDETSHYRITRGILENPELYWRHLLDDPDKRARQRPRRLSRVLPCRPCRTSARRSSGSMIRAC
jgi:predicted ATPase